MWSELTDTLLHDFRHDPAVLEQVDALEHAVTAGEMSPAAAAHRLLEAFRPAIRRD